MEDERVLETLLLSIETRAQLFNPRDQPIEGLLLPAERPARLRAHHETTLFPIVPLISFIEQRMLAGHP